jgi:hypothetical protein
MKENQVASQVNGLPFNPYAFIRVHRMPSFHDEEDVSCSSTHSSTTLTEISPAQAKEVHFHPGLVIGAGSEKGRHNVQGGHVVPEYVFRVCFLGVCGVGKSAIIDMVSRICSHHNLR